MIIRMITLHWWKRTLCRCWRGLLYQGLTQLLLVMMIFLSLQLESIRNLKVLLMSLSLTEKGASILLRMCYLQNGLRSDVDILLSSWSINLLYLWDLWDLKCLWLFVDIFNWLGQRNYHFIHWLSSMICSSLALVSVKNESNFVSE